MSSPLYLERLNEIFPQIYEELPSSNLDRLWAGLEMAWSDMQSVPTNSYLKSMATHAFLIAGHLSNKSAVRLIADAMQLHEAKNRGYAGSDPDPWRNFRLANRFGVNTKQGVLVRLSDKYSRILSLHESADNNQVGENLLDTVLDFAAYCLIATCVDAENGTTQTNTAEYDNAFD